MPNKVFVKDNKDNTFTVQLFYHAKISELLSKIENKEYNSELRVYTIPQESIDLLINGLIGLNIHVQEVEELPDQKPLPKIAYIKQSNEIDDSPEILTKFSPTMVQFFKEVNMKYNHEHGSWVCKMDDLIQVEQRLAKDGYKIVHVDEFDPSWKPKIKVS